MQNLNLYQTQRRRHTGPRPRHMLLALLVALVLALLHGGWQLWQVRDLQAQLQQAEALKQELQAMRETYREGLKMLSTLEAMLIDDKSLTGLSRQMAYQQFKKRLERTGIKAQRALEEKIRRLEG